MCETHAVSDFEFWASVNRPEWATGEAAPGEFWVPGDRAANPILKSAVA